MSSKFRKFMKFVPQFFTILGAVSVAFAMLLSMINIPVKADPGQPCPMEGLYVKLEYKEGGDNYNYNEFGWVRIAPDADSASWGAFEPYVFLRACIKAGDDFYYVDNPNGTDKLTKYDISHVVVYFNQYNSTPETPTPETPTPETPTPETPTPETPTPETPTPETPTPETPTPETPTPETPTPETPTPETPTPETPTPETPTPETPTPETPTPETPTPETPTPENPSPTPEDPTGTPTDPGTTPTPDDPQETPTPGDPTPTPPTDETPDPTQPPTLPPPVTTTTPSVLIPVTGMEIGGDSPLDKVQSVMFNLGLGFLGLGLVLQSLRKKLNF
jgi:hypothetical protein